MTLIEALADDPLIAVRDRALDRFARSLRHLPVAVVPEADRREMTHHASRRRRRYGGLRRDAILKKAERVEQSSNVYH